MRSLGQNPTQAEVAAILSEVEDDGKGNVDFPVFGDIVARKMKDPDSEEEEIVDILKVLDSTDGKMSKDDLCIILHKLGEEVQPEEIEDIFRGVEIDENGMLDYESFVRIMKKRTPEEAKAAAAVEAAQLKAEQRED